ncbi:hypothetical protein HMPREF9413_0060 [Paenibacillus sp. HGF7]|nr:hypothetical protein HMPREF9413_0060 [Paenibacillus sp. HGF7]
MLVFAEVPKTCEAPVNFVPGYRDLLDKNRKLTGERKLVWLVKMPPSRITI